ncbi:hypothetical protein OG788_03480 [Streptomyces sp. NBC_00647]
MLALTWMITAVRMSESVLIVAFSSLWAAVTIAVAAVWICAWTRNQYL